MSPQYDKETVELFLDLNAEDPIGDFGRAFINTIADRDDLSEIAFWVAADNGQHISPGLAYELAGEVIEYLEERASIG